MADHLVYEWRMLNHTLDRISSGSVDVLDRNAFLESFALHARVLHDFLTNEAGNNNFNAKDFVPGFKVNKTNDTIGTMQLINAQMAHSGKRRTSVPENKVNTRRCEALFEWIKEGMTRLVAALDNDLRNVWAGITPPITTTHDINLNSAIPSATNSISTTQFRAPIKSDRD